MKSTHLPQYQDAIGFEEALGALNDPENLFTPTQILRLDEAEIFPEEQAKQLTALGMNAHYLPVALGGKLASFESFIQVFRSLYRRDSSLGLGYGATTFMAAMPIFLAGTPQQKERMAALILAGHTLSVAYHEAPHGNDILGNEVYASEDKLGEHQLYGQKWVINNAAVSAGFTVFAKTAAKGGGRGFSLFFVDTLMQKTQTLTMLPKVKTLGVRGCRIAGVEFNATTAQMIGQKGQGVELTFKAFQITRATLPGMSLGAADTALRTVMDFAHRRVLYSHTLIKLPHVNETLVDSFIQLLICDAVSITAARALHVIPEQMSIIAASSKFFIPKTIQTMLKKLAVILGARHYIRGEAHSLFEKILRDYPVVSLGHSSDVICLQTLLPQMRFLLNKSHTGSMLLQNILDLFSLDRPLPEFDAFHLKISNGGYHDILQSLPFIEQMLPKEMAFSLQPTLSMLRTALLNLKENEYLLATSIATFSESTYIFLETYIRIFVALSCIWLWICNQAALGGFFAQGGWLLLALNLLFPEQILTKHQQATLRVEALAQLNALHITNSSFALIPIHYS